MGISLGRNAPAAGSALEKADLLDDTLIIVSADHGGHNKVHSGAKLIDREIDLVFNTTSGKKAIEDSYSIRRQTLMHGIPYFTALTSCRAAVAAIEALHQGPLTVKPLQEYHSVA